MNRLTQLGKYLRLTFELTRREVGLRYSGTVLGFVWAFVNPLALLAVYSIVFGTIFQSRWGGEGATFDFALILFVGLIAYNLFSECVNRAPSLIATNPNYVKKVVFPVAVLPVVVLGSALFHASISLIAWHVLYFILHGTLNWTGIFVIPIFVPIALMTLGFSLFLASLGVYLRDIGQFTSLLTQSMLFLSPVFYSVEQAPRLLRVFLEWNPLTYVIEQSRAALVDGQIPQLSDWLLNLVLSVLILAAGYWWFQRTRDGFADVV